MEDIVIRDSDLRTFISATVAGAGSSPEEAETVAHNLVLANLSGHDSHGVGMIPLYITNVQSGLMFANRHASVVSETGALITIEGHRGYGQSIGREAMDIGIDRAKRHGVAFVGVRNSHHLARIGHWAEQCGEAGLVSIHFVNCISRPLVAPYGGSDARLATNPFCVGVPRPGHPLLLLDFATSRIALGKTRVAYNKGVQVPPGCLIDSEGRPTVEPKVMWEQPYGALQPFGDHKGWALAFMCELLAGALSGGETLHWSESSTVILNNMVSVIVDPNRLEASGTYLDQIDRFVEWARQSPPAPGFDKVRVAGETEMEFREERGRNGIPIDATTWAQLLDAGRRAGLSQDELARFDAMARRSGASHRTAAQ